MRKLTALVLLLSGCGHAQIEAHRVALPVNEVPVKVMQVAQKKFPDIKFDTAWKLDTGAIEVRGKNKVGKIQEVEVSPAGDIVEFN